MTPTCNSLPMFRPSRACSARSIRRQLPPFAASVQFPARERTPALVQLRSHKPFGAADLLLSSLSTAGITVLNNRAVEVVPSFWLAGVDELREGEPDLPGTLRQVPEHHPCVLLAHNPNTLDLVPSDWPIAILAGHT